jgi:hypothetical protein
MAYTLYARQGNTLPVVIRFKQANDSPYDLTDSAFVFRVVFPGGAYTKSSEDGEITIDRVTGTITTSLTVDETRAMPIGSFAKYEIERHFNGEQVTWLDGTITVREGVNDDA